MIKIPSSRSEREVFWDKHIFSKLYAKLTKNGWNSTDGRGRPSSDFISGRSDNFDLEVTKPVMIGNTQTYFPIAPVFTTIIVRFRPQHRKYHYSLEIRWGSYTLEKESRRFRYKWPDLTTLSDAIDYLYKKVVEEKQLEETLRSAKEELQKKRVEEAKEIAKAIHCDCDINDYGNFTLRFKTFDGRKIEMKFHLSIDKDGDVDDFEIEGKIKRHHFYSIIDSLRKAVPDNYGNGLVKKRKIDLTSDIVTRISKNESNIKNLQFSKIRAWKRNFNLKEN